MRPTGTARRRTGSAANSCRRTAYRCRSLDDRSWQQGAEFEAVHVPGITVSSFRPQNRGQRCPPPDGMIEGADRASTGERPPNEPTNMKRSAYSLSAASRARTHLRLYLARQQPNGANRSASPFLDGLAAREIAQPAQITAYQPDTPRSGANCHHLGGRTGTSPRARLRLYENCPRRFFYTHVFGLGHARETTAFSRTHDCPTAHPLALQAERVAGEPDEAAASANSRASGKRTAQRTMPYAADYLHLAGRGWCRFL